MFQAMEVDVAAWLAEGVEMVSIPSLDSAFWRLRWVGILYRGL